MVMDDMDKRKRPTLEERIKALKPSEVMEIHPADVSREEWAELMRMGAINRVERIVKLSKHESTREFVLQSWGMIDSLLTELLSIHMVAGWGDKLFGESRTVRNADIKVDLACALGLIPESDRRTIHLIRKIRTEFVHLPELYAFEHSDKVQGNVRNLITAPPDFPLDNRTRFMLAASGCVSRLEGYVESAAKRACVPCPEPTKNEKDAKRPECQPAE